MNQTNKKLEYLNSNTFEEIVQELLFNFPISLQRRKHFLLWEFNVRRQSIIPSCLNSNRTNKFSLIKSMKGPLVSLNLLRKIVITREFQNLIRGNLYGISLNLKNIPNLVIVDIDDFDLQDLNSPITADSSNQRLVIESLKHLPAYVEVSVSKRGLHIFFSFQNFEKFLDNRFISSPASKVEIFVGGGPNKMVLLTGNVLPSNEFNQDFETIVARKNRINYKIVQATKTQLRPFLKLLEEFSRINNKKTVISNRALISDETKLPNWLKNFSNFKNRISPEDKSSKLTLEEQQGDSFFISKIEKLKILSLTKNYSQENYKSQSEVDYAVFSLLLKFLKFEVTEQNVSSVVWSFLNFYEENFPLRLTKHSQYLVRTAYKVFLNSYSKTGQISSNLPLESSSKVLIKTPLGLLGKSLKFSEQKCIVDNMDLLKNFDFDLYQTLLHLSIENSQTPSLDLGSISNLKISIRLSIGYLARRITKKNNVSSFYYSKILESLFRLSSTRLTWNNQLSQGSVALLEYIHIKDTKMVEISFTSLLAWFLFIDTKTIKNSKLDYTVYYSHFFNIYQTSEQRRLYRFLINNLPVKTSRKVLKVDKFLLENFYNNYSKRRHSAFKTSFFKSINEFSKITSGDVSVQIVGQKLILSRISF